MKKTLQLLYVSLALFALCFSNINAQGVGISIDGSTPDASAMFDVESNSNGMLIPRMREAQKDIISNPATGLLIYQTDAIIGFYFFNGSIWVPFDGWQGSKTRIKITPMDFQSDDADDNMRMDQQGRYCYESGTASPVCTMATPIGYKVKAVMIYGSDATNAVTVRRNKYSNGTTNNVKGTGTVNTEITFSFSSGENKYLSIFVDVGANDRIYGGYMRIEPL